MPEIPIPRRGRKIACERAVRSLPPHFASLQITRSSLLLLLLLLLVFSRRPPAGTGGESKVGISIESQILKKLIYLNGFNHIKI